MSIISQESFDKLTKEEKEKLREYFSDNNESIRVNYIMDDIFGKENIQPKPKIKTWEDVAIHKTEIWDETHKVISTISGCSRIGNKILNKLIATIQIQKLIELGYGGMVTEKEWKLSTSYIQETALWSIVYEYKIESKKPQFRIIVNWTQPKLVSFHTKQQAEEFMSYPENRILVEQYYMI